MTINREVRENAVLDEIVKFHIKSAMPVGSKHIARTLNLSSATIRNVMLDLEKRGYVKQPHTSAGRIPTDRGYRKYVDNMSHLVKLERDDLYSKIKKYMEKKKLLEEVIEAASYAVSRATNYTGLALSPNNKLYFDGTYHMLEQPEFRELEVARDFLRMIEEKEDLLSMLHEDLVSTEGISIKIGRENRYIELRECTIITSTYKLKDSSCGKIGIIGPMRMDYEEMVPMVEYITNFTTDILEEML